VPGISVKKNRKRYIAFKIESEKNISFDRKQVIKSIQSTCLELFHTQCKTFDFFLTRFHHNIGILRGYHTEKKRAIQLLHSVTSIDNEPVMITSLATSGTIKTLIKKHLDGDTLQEK